MSSPSTKTAQSPLTEAQWAVLMAIMDGILPPLERGASAQPSSVALSEAEYDATVSHLRRNTVLDMSDTKLFDSFLAESPSQIGKFRDTVERLLLVMPAKRREGLASLMSIMDTRIGSFLFAGSLTPFAQLSVEDRGKVVQSWKSSSLPMFRLLFKQFTMMAKNTYLRTSPSVNELIGFPARPPPCSPKMYPYEFVQVAPSEEPAEIKADVVIVGSGCGAGVAAKNLAAAGLDVLVVEKGYHTPAAEMPYEQNEFYFDFFDQSGLLAAEDGSIGVYAGSCFGGGGTVNWSASLQTPGYVRKEWSEDRGLKFFGTVDFQECLERVSEQMGVSDKHLVHNHGNRVLLDGARRLGLDARPVPQNTGGHEHSDGYCCLGCGRGEKQGPVNGWFPDAARSGARFMEGFRADKIIFDTSNGKKTAQGVQGTWSPRNHGGKAPQRVIIRAKRVVVCAGTLRSPALLLNSGLKNKQIGRNLYLHPASLITGFFKEDVKPWEGPMVTAVVNSLENLDGKGHGAKMERSAMVPVMSLTWFDWTSGLDFKRLSSKYRHMETYFSMARDRDPGYVTLDKETGDPLIHYTPSSFDVRHMKMGLVALCKIMYVQGALEIHPCLAGLPPFVRHQEGEGEGDSGDSNDSGGRFSDAGIMDDRFQAWLKKLEAHPGRTPETSYGAAHQMGTCRMSARAGDGVVNEDGKVWGTEGLYVADSSVFPSASGVNPMLTIMAISDWISRGIARDMKAQQQGA